MAQKVKSPSMSGEASEYNLGGSSSYGDALSNNHLIGDLSSQGMNDSNHSLVPTLHNFTYDVYFYGTDLGLSQAEEFDINQFYDNLGFVWGARVPYRGRERMGRMEPCDVALDPHRYPLLPEQQFMEPSHPQSAADIEQPIAL
jgi:hypothetical protein